jgi:hypothetical protein
MPKAMAKERAFKQALKDIRTSINPNVRSYAVRNNPKPLRAHGTVWIKRVSRVVKTQPASSAAVLISITNGDLVTAGMPTGTRFRIISIRSWNSTSSGQSSGFVSINWDETTTYTGVGQVVMSDTGSATSLPGVGIALPKALSKIETAATSSASNLISVRSAQVGVDVPAAQNLILDFEFEIAV